jgi:hypothetical protein
MVRFLVAIVREDEEETTLIVRTLYSKIAPEVEWPTSYDIPEASKAES